MGWTKEANTEHMRAFRGVHETFSALLSKTKKTRSDEMLIRAIIMLSMHVSPPQDPDTVYQDVLETSRLWQKQASPS